MKRFKLVLGSCTGALAAVALLTGTSFAAVPPFSTLGIYTSGTPANNPFNSNWFMPPDSDRMPLAFTKSTANSNAFWPALATRWRLSPNGRDLTVWLRSNAKWSNGTPVTADDVKFTMAAEFATGKNYWNLSGVRVKNPHEVVLQMAPGIRYNLFETSALQQLVEPASVYARLMPKNIWHTIQLSEYHGSNTAKQHDATVAKRALTALGQKLESYNPPVDVSDGPFILKATNPSEQLLVKNPDYWDAARIHVQRVVLHNWLGNSTAWNFMDSGVTDEATSVMPPNVKKAAQKVPGNHFFNIPTYYVSELVFNEHVYPYNLVKVRQALAYLINRRQVDAVAAPLAQQFPIRWEDGMDNGANKAYLTPGQLAKLNPYRVNVNKATALLRSAGFKKNKAGNWLLPNGRPWTASIYMDTASTDYVVAGTVISHEMTRFGIPTDVHPVTTATYDAQQILGKYGLSFLFAQAGPTPFEAYNTFFTTADGYNLESGALTYTASASKGNWVDFPQTVTVRGVGKVSAGPLTYQLEEVSNPATLKKDVANLAFTVNQDVPVLPLYTEMVDGFYNTRHYTDYPMANPKILRAVLYFAPIFWMDMGYIRAK